MSRMGKKEKKSFGQRIIGMKTWKKIAILVFFLIVMAVIIASLSAKEYVEEKVEEMYEPTPEDYDLSLVEVDGYINILLLGVDSRDMSDLKGTRSDMMMIASINQETYEVKLTSIYRDTYLKLGDTPTYDKVTHACVYGGPEMTMKSLNQALDLNITNYAIVNFKAVADLVDAMGGITVEIQENEIQQLNKYTKQTAKNIGRTEYGIVKEAGMHTLDGCQAVSYGRIRKGVGDDFKRTERMRIVVSKVFTKAKTMSFSELKDIINLMVPQVKTNLTMNDILALGIRLPQYDISSGTGFPYKWSAGYINDISYVFPAGGLASNVKQLHEEVFGQTDYTPSSTVYAISNEIIARLEAAREAEELKGEEEGESTQDENLGGEDEGLVEGEGEGDIEGEGDDPEFDDPEFDDPEAMDPDITDPSVPENPDVTDPSVPENPDITDPSVTPDPGTTVPDQSGTAEGEGEGTVSGEADTGEFVPPADTPETPADTGTPQVTEDGAGTGETTPDEPTI